MKRIVASLIDVSHVFVVNVDLLAFAAVLVDHLFVYHDFLDELIENVKICCGISARYGNQSSRRF